MKSLRGIWRFAMAAAAVAAVVQELNKPASERTWQGHVADLVPYDFRKPTMDRFVEAHWNPDGPVLSNKAWGAGWAFNFGAAKRLLAGDDTMSLPSAEV